MNILTKLIEDYDGPIEVEYQVWHVMIFSDTNRTACGHAVDAASHHVAEHKRVERGGITCKDCLRMVLEHKAIKL